MSELDRQAHCEPFTLRLIGGCGLWLAPSRQDDDEAANPARTGEYATRTTPHVLIVEDELFVAWHISDLIEDMGYVVAAISASGEDAVTKARALRPDFVLMDINLGGGIDGIEAAKAIAASSDTPIIFVTAYSDGPTLTRVREAMPNNAFLVHKPVSAPALRKAMAAAAKPPTH
jgi:CheY-like chemotaxis protein